MLNHVKYDPLRGNLRPPHLYSITDCRCCNIRDFAIIATEYCNEVARATAAIAGPQKDNSFIDIVAIEITAKRKVARNACRGPCFVLPAPTNKCNRLIK